MKARDEIDELISQVSTNVQRSDRDALREALRKCYHAGLPRRCVLEAESHLAELEKLLEELKGAVASCNLTLLEQSISKCRTTGMPSKYIEEALASQQKIRGLMQKLEAACKTRDAETLEATVQDWEGSEPWEPWDLLQICCDRLQRVTCGVA